MKYMILYINPDNSYYIKGFTNKPILRVTNYGKTVTIALKEMNTLFTKLPDKDVISLNL